MYSLDGLIFLSGKAVFSTEQQPGSALVALMIRFGPKVVNVSTGAFFPGGHIGLRESWRR